ncbi:hypothetical protein C8A03DRAFT_35789 [Achaetomium macrosporum]|uniref:Uncharacterized protein n=1 Tax=Achaetomium macrosporum TaxID=79813 RepID=A0AAN7HAG2_9PEZI|nr:hypothetical protein C8A03DRAFT_35789 [Achaetomium macrosporum]
MSSTTQTFTGIWPNYDSESSHTTWTLTVRQGEGGVLSSALVLFVGFAATQAWNVVKYVLHQLQAGTAKDGYNQQLQAMLRNSSTHGDAAWYAIRIPLGWRKQGVLLRALARASPILVVSLFFMALWVVAQIFLPRLWTGASDEFLVGSRIRKWTDPSVLVAERHMIYRTQIRISLGIRG